MTDRELLEAAAKAAGIETCGWRAHEFQPGYFVNPPVETGAYAVWNPLADDGDALRLAVRLGLHIQPSDTDCWATHLAVTAIEPLGSDPYAATRRAIVRAAAAMAGAA
jgi:hypothetical protein